MKQIEYEKSQALISEADRAFELIGRAIRIAGYQNIQSKSSAAKNKLHPKSGGSFIEVNKRTGFRGSDALSIRHELSDGVDFDCIGNVITKERTKNHLALQGFLVDRQAGVPKGKKVNGGSLICMSFDRHGSIQNTTLMNGVNRLLIEEQKAVQAHSPMGQKLFKVRIEMTDGAQLNLELERTFSTRNFL